VIFTNKTSKTWAESEKKRSSKFVVLVFMGNAKTETYKRNEGEKKSKPTPSQISSSYTRYLGRKRTTRSIQWHERTSFSTTAVIYMCRPKTTEWLTHASTTFYFFYVSKDNITLKTKKLLLTIMKWRIGPCKMLWALSF